MKLPQKLTPDHYVNRTNQQSDKSVSLPFQLIRCGYSNERALRPEVNYQAYCLFYVLSGTACFTKQKDTFYMNKEDAVITSCNTGLSFFRVTPDIEYFYVIITGSSAKLYYNMVRGVNTVIHITPLHNIYSYFTELCTMKMTNDILDQMNVCFVLHEIIHELVLLTQDVDQARLTTPIQQTVVNIAMKYIEEHYREDLTVDKICQEVSFSKYYFCKLFKENTGMTLYQYLIQYRVNKSKELLTYSKLSIHAIALDVGFKNTLSYSRCFKQYNQMTPSEYRIAY